jgi:hypothetical protein
MRSALIGLLAVVAVAGPASAHSPLLSCFRNTDMTITCEAGYSDGAAATGQAIQVIDLAQRIVLEDVFGTNSDFTFTPPQDPGFQVVFIGDTAHIATVLDDEIL